MRIILSAVLSLAPLIVSAGSFDADVVVIGETHDNPAHHVRQAEIVAQIAPKALVFEMLTPEQAKAHIPAADQATLAQAFQWDQSGWPDFAMYYPIFEAAPDAEVFGAGIPPDQARAGKDQLFAEDAERFGLNEPLPEAEQEAREAMQFAAHCDMLPPEMLPIMVDIQRLRDASLARETLRALELTGGPVVVITGNGHARRDWGMPVYVQRAKPEVRLISIGLADGALDRLNGVFDQVEALAQVTRPDPCAAFK